MRKTVIIILAALVCSTAAFSQKKGHWTVNISGVYAGNLTLSGAGEDMGNALGEILATVITLGLYTPDNGGYARTDTRDFPGVAIQGGYQALSWAQITGDLYYHRRSYERYKNKDDVSPGKAVRMNRVSFLPGVKFTYIRKKSFRVYSSVSAGMGFNFGKTVTGDEMSRLNKIKFTFQTVPVGVAVGRWHYGFLDLGAGTEYFCLRAGYGYNF